MAFVDNEQFAKWLEQSIGEPAFERHSTPARTIKKMIPGAMARMWRWYHNRMLATSQHFNTIMHKREANSIEDRGWTIIEIPSRQHVTKSHLFYEIAHGLNRAITQLSHKTQVSTEGSYPHSIIGHYAPPQELYKYDEEVPPMVAVTEYQTYENEWQRFVFQVQSIRYFDRPDCYYLAVAYDALNDCLYVNYLS